MTFAPMNGYLLETCYRLDPQLGPEKVARKTMDEVSLQNILHLTSSGLVDVTRKAVSGDLILNAPLERWLVKATQPDAIRFFDI